MEINYENDIAIDEQALDVEWLRQPDLMRKYTAHAADMKKEMDEAKERLEVRKAELERDIRTSPGDYDLLKVTESAIQSTIMIQQGYKDHMQDFIDAKYEYDIAVAAVRAMDQKKTALENLVKLLGQSYFAGPQSPRDLSHEVLNRRQANNKVKIQRRRG